MQQHVKAACGERFSGLQPRARQKCVPRALEKPGTSIIQQQKHEMVDRARAWGRQRQGRRHRPPPGSTPTSSSTSLLERPAPSNQPPAPDPTNPSPSGGGGEPWLPPKLALLVAAMLWGSYSVAVRLLYSAADPPDASVVMAARGILQAAAMLAIFSAFYTPGQQQQQQQQQRQDGQHPHQKQEQKAALLEQRTPNTDASAAAGAETKLARSAQPGQPQSSMPLLQQFLRLEAPPLWMAAVELGLWNYTATALQTLGLQMSSATRASFLIQATVMLTPLLSMAAGYRPGRRTWAGCGLALAGTLLVTADEAGASAGGGWEAASLQLGGDGAILAAALFYSLGVVRMAGYTRTLAPAQIATSKSLVLGCLALGSLVLVSGTAAVHGQPLRTLWGDAASDPRCWAALLWSGLGPGALASYLHAQGQKHVAPAQAQIIFSSKPLWAAGIAWVLLGGEQLGALSWIGGATLMTAGIVAATDTGSKDSSSTRSGSTRSGSTSSSSTSSSSTRSRSKDEDR